MNENLINWNDFYSVGDDLMDEQHKNLIGLINELFNAFKQGKAHEISNKILTQMSEHGNTHFRDEEILLEKLGLTEIEEHKRLHKVYKEKIDELQKKSEKNSQNLHYEIIEFLKRWWSEHVLVEDMKYAKVIKNQ